MAIRRWSPLAAMLDNVGGRLWTTVRENWYLGFASFGGPPVHFKIISTFEIQIQTVRANSMIPMKGCCWPYWWLLSLTGESRSADRYFWEKFHDKFVEKLEWIDEQVYQEPFSVCQAFSGPGSTKMHYCINLLHDGFIPVAFGFLLWSLPGAVGMYALALGISNIEETLPRAVYTLLSGLNSATVGIVALVAVQLSEKAITDPLTRVLVFLSAAAGLMYNALWYFPLLMILAGLAAVMHDFR